MTHPHRLRPDSRRGPGNDSRRGAALVLSLIMVMVCASLGAAFTQLASSAARQQTHEVAQLQAFYVAEAGLAEGFFAVRMGRTGQIASEAVPARFGGADVWVESYTDGDTTFLRSNARRARSDASLALVIRPEPPELGFFSDETLVLEGAVLVDGFDSTVRSYDEEVAFVNGGAASDPPVDHDDDDGPIVYDANYFMCVFGESVFLSVVQNQIITFGGSAGVLVNSPVAVTELLTEQELAEFQAQALSFAATYGSPSPWAVDSDLATLFGSTMGSGGVTPEPEVTAPETPTRTKPTATTGDHTPTGGLLGSNGDVVFMADAAESEIFGAVRPGPDGSVTGLPESNVTGATEARAVAVPMDPVVVPDISSSGDLSVSGGIPTVLSTPEVGYGVVTVGPGEDLELRGPMTIIVTDLILESGARLTLDTTAGDVQLFVRRDVTLDPTSAIATATIPGFGAS
ncbi:MAG: pilus assembly PilX N-terminal domain-containing protein, partial [Planctomycetota bacterium]